MKSMNKLCFPNKQIRSKVLKQLLSKYNIEKVVCFSCGNATAELKKTGLQVLDVSPNGVLLPNKWFSSLDFAYNFPNFFNATSGYLPIDIMKEIGLAYKEYLGNLQSPCYVPCGSGETLICLKLAYPQIDFIAVYDNTNPATKYDNENPLNEIVAHFAKGIIIKG